MGDVSLHNERGPQVGSSGRSSPGRRRKLPRAAYSKSYQVIQCRQVIRSGQVEQVDIFSCDHLFCAYLTAKIPKVQFPSHSKRCDIAIRRPNGPEAC